MAIFQKAGRVAASVCVVLGLGYLVQGGASGQQDPLRRATQPTTSIVHPAMMTKNPTGDPVFGARNVWDSDLPASSSVVPMDDIHEVLTEVVVPRMNFVTGSPMDGCKTSIEAAAEMAAMVALDVQSPCHRDSYLVIWHEDMAFSVLTDSAGQATANVPALDTDAVFVVTYENVEEARVAINVPDMGRYDRAVLHWRSRDNLQLHALEFGAGFGDPGHVWSASTQAPELAQAGQRGYVVRLGQSDAPVPYWSEIYTFPSGRLTDAGEIVLQVGATVTAANCGHRLAGFTGQTGSDKPFALSRMTMEIPGCDQVDRAVFRSDLFDDLVLAAR
ncbi:hypothetical protein [Yoonia sp. SS1-5]|uniref:Uncharacterized protein n=1 Tax=Yoonia rhodophyticola TaxID=3137370 RepID=A0AAN0MBW7_9RHOB